MGSMAPERGEGGGREVAEARILGGVDIGLDGGEAWRRKLVRREAKKAVLEEFHVRKKSLDTAVSPNSRPTSLPLPNTCKTYRHSS